MPVCDAGTPSNNLASLPLCVTKPIPIMLFYIHFEIHGFNGFFYILLLGCNVLFRQSIEYCFGNTYFGNKGYYPS